MSRTKSKAASHPQKNTLTPNWEVTERLDMPRKRTSPPNPNRVAAGYRNWLLRKGLSEEGRLRLRDTALAHQPWRFATGPRTLEGKARSAANGKRRQSGDHSIRELRDEVAEIRSLIDMLRSVRNAALNDAVSETEGG